MTLYELSNQYELLLDMLSDPNEDEEVIIDTIDAIKGEIEVKADGYGKIITMMNSNVKAIDEEIKRLQAKKQVLDNRTKLLKNSVYGVMKQMEVNKIKTDLFTFSIQKNGGVLPLEIVGEVPDNYTKITYEVDKDKIRNELQKGKELEFARFGDRGESLRIR